MYVRDSHKIDYCSDVAVRADPRRLLYGWRGSLSFSLRRGEQYAGWPPILHPAESHDGCSSMDPLVAASFFYKAVSYGLTAFLLPAAWAKATRGPGPVRPCSKLLSNLEARGRCKSGQGALRWRRASGQVVLDGCRLGFRKPEESNVRAGERPALLPFICIPTGMLVGFSRRRRGSVEGEFWVQNDGRVILPDFYRYPRPEGMPIGEIGPP